VNLDTVCAFSVLNSQKIVTILSFLEVGTKILKCGTLGQELSKETFVDLLYVAMQSTCMMDTY